MSSGTNNGITEQFDTDSFLAFIGILRREKTSVAILGVVSLVISAALYFTADPLFESTCAIRVGQVRQSALTNILALKDELLLPSTDKKPGQTTSAKLCKVSSYPRKTPEILQVHSCSSEPQAAQSFARSVVEGLKAKQDKLYETLFSQGKDEWKELNIFVDGFQELSRRLKTELEQPDNIKMDPSVRMATISGLVNSVAAIGNYKVDILERERHLLPPHTTTSRIVGDCPAKAVKLHPLKLIYLGGAVLVWIILSAVVVVIREVQR